MNEGIKKTLEELISIIQLQTRIIDRLSGELLQHTMLEEEDLGMIQEAAQLQAAARKEGLL